MLKAIACVVVFLLLPVAILAQQLSPHDLKSIERDFKQFRKTFDDEISSVKVLHEKDSVILFHPNPERLPAWTTEFIRHDNDSLYFIGISEPGMDSALAFDLAKHRAWLMLSISLEPFVSNMREQFTGEAARDFRELFIEYSNFSTEIFIQMDSLKVQNTHRTQYNETIAQFAIATADITASDTEKPSFMLRAGLYTSAARASRNMQVDEKLQLESLSISGDPENDFKHTYSYDQVKNIVNTTTTLNDSLISDLPALNLRYSLKENDQNQNLSFEPEINPGYSLRNGLWHALLTGIFSTLADETHNGSLHFRQIGDVYNSTSVFLSRELITLRAETLKPQFYIHNNRLYIQTK